MTSSTTWYTHWLQDDILLCISCTSMLLTLAQTNNVTKQDILWDCTNHSQVGPGIVEYKLRILDAHTTLYHHLHITHKNTLASRGGPLGPPAYKQDSARLCGSTDALGPAQCGCLWAWCAWVMTAGPWWWMSHDDAGIPRNCSALIITSHKPWVGSTFQKPGLAP